ncbi:TonB-dependent receptor domain-containing protein [Alistipes sp. ZOR0009]|uniref:TonB-dependent receptor n=1 Tax=Alistipes sp. ZOR0009 TaxID=1339253 RepID=UPI0009DE89D2|nr:TonB-dependent receptor [Alistipes sp. ZOR0009]
MRISIKRLLLTLAVAMITTFAFGQGATTSAFNGKIYDAKGVSLPGATVQFTHLPTGTKYGTVTNANGAYFVPNVKSGGPYLLTVTFVGFSEFQKNDIQAELGENVQVNASLSDKDVKIQEVVITGTLNKVFNSSRTGASTNVSTKDMTSMPTISRSVADFAKLSPQVSTSNNGISIAGTNNRYNNFQIDGTVNNDVFGLSSSGTNGGQAGTTPISVDAIEEISIVVAPFDVRQSGFTGGGINAITKGGTNMIKGTAYILGNNESLVGKYSVAQKKDVKVGNYDDKTYGVSIGGPIIKNKLFLFVNGEFSKKSVPSSFNIDGGSLISKAQAQSVLEELEKKGIMGHGGYSSFNTNTESKKLFTRLDYNISEKHKLVLRYNYVDAFDDKLSRSDKSLTFNNGGYKFNNKTHGLVAELNSRFNPILSNEFRFGYTRIRDSRVGMGGRIPNITIENYTSGDGLKFYAGSEPFSTANSLNQDIYTLTDNFNVFLGKHTFTIGTHNELYKFKNIFIRDNTGSYVFSTFNDFVNLKAKSYNYSFADPNTTNGDKSWGPTFTAMQLGFYAQDEFKPYDNLKLTLGVRADIPIFMDKPSLNARFDTLSVAVANGVSTNKLPKSRVLWSPRFGFNWDVFSDKTTQVRGGAGVFTGRVPFVWVSNQFSNTGNEYVRVSYGGSSPFPSDFAFNSDAEQQYYPAAALTDPKFKSSEVDVTSRDFRYPQVFRLSLGVDQKLPYDIQFTGDVLYSKTLNNILYKNIKYTETSTTIKEGGLSERVLYTQAYPSSISNFTDIILLDNTNKGYSYTISGQLSKKFNFGLNTMVAYTYGKSKSVNDGTSSQALSNWKYNYVYTKSNSPELSYSQFDVRNRVIASVGYTHNWGKITSTTVSLFYTGFSGNPYSLNYGYSSNVSGVVRANASINGDFQTGNDQMYIPTDAEIDAMKANNQFQAIGTSVTVDAMVDAYKKFLATDDYTKNNRGKYAERNGARTPWENRIDLHLAQDFYFTIAQKKQTIQVTFDVLNFANMLNKDWGVSYVTNYNVPTISFVGFRPTTTGGSTPDYTKPVFQFNPTAFKTNQTYTQHDFFSRWRGQIGIRYIF